jgi:hypothetical protein
MLVCHPVHIGKAFDGFKAEIERPPTFGAVSPQPAKLAGLFFGFIFVVERTLASASYPVKVINGTNVTIRINTYDNARLTLEPRLIRGTARYISHYEIRPNKKNRPKGRLKFNREASKHHVRQGGQQVTL